MIRVDVRIEEAVRYLEDVRLRQVPFALSQAINATATQVQLAERREMEGQFSLRRKDWAMRNVKIRREDFATKVKPSAIVRMEAPGGGSRSDILAKFEDGGTKKPRDGRRLAIPDKARRGAKGVVPAAMRPKAFEFKLWGTGPRGEIYQGKNRTWMIKRPDGTGGIYQRTGRGTKAGKTAGRRRMQDARDRNVKTLYRFTPSARIDSRLHFEETAKGVIRARVSANFDEALRKAIASGRKTPGAPAPAGR